MGPKGASQLTSAEPRRHVKIRTLGWKPLLCIYVRKAKDMLRLACGLCPPLERANHTKSNLIPFCAKKGSRFELNDTSLAKNLCSHSETCLVNRNKNIFSSVRPVTLPVILTQNISNFYEGNVCNSLPGYNDVYVVYSDSSGAQGNDVGLTRLSLCRWQKLQSMHQNASSPDGSHSH